MAIVIRRLEEHDEVENFDCGDDALNNYLKRHAWTNQRKSSIGVSHVALDEDDQSTSRRLLIQLDCLLTKPDALSECRVTHPMCIANFPERRFAQPDV